MHGTIDCKTVYSLEADTVSPLLFDLENELYSRDECSCSSPTLQSHQHHTHHDVSRRPTSTRVHIKLVLTVYSSDTISPLLFDLDKISQQGRAVQCTARPCWEILYNPIWEILYSTRTTSLY